MVPLYNLDAGQYQSWAILSKKPIKSVHLKRSHEVTVSIVSLKAPMFLVITDNLSFFLFRIDYSISHFYDKTITYKVVIVKCNKIDSWFHFYLLLECSRMVLLKDGQNRQQLLKLIDFQNISGFRRVFFILESDSSSTWSHEHVACTIIGWWLEIME